MHMVQTFNFNIAEGNKLQTPTKGIIKYLSELNITAIIFQEVYAVIVIKYI